MGFTPRQVDEMSLWELSACIDGWNEAHGGEAKTDGMSVERLRELNPPRVLH